MTCGRMAARSFVRPPLAPIRTLKMTCLLALLLLASAPAPVEAVTPARAPVRLKWEPKVDLPVTAVLGTGLLLTETVFKKPLAPAQCRWCAHNALDDALTGIRAPLGQQRTVDLVSYLTLGVMPAGGLLYSFWQADDFTAFGVDTLLVVEAVLAAAAFNQLVKFTVGRERPFVARLSQEAKVMTSHPDDNNVSFFSGHATMAFSLATAVGTVAELRGYRYRAWVWSIGMALATTTTVLRMVADKHYFTDVLTGAVVGAAFGYGLPALLHGVDTGDGALKQVRLVPGLGGMAVVGHF